MRVTTIRANLRTTKTKILNTTATAILMASMVGGSLPFFLSQHAYADAAPGSSALYPIVLSSQADAPADSVTTGPVTDAQTCNVHQTWTVTVAGTPAVTGTESKYSRTTTTPGLWGMWIAQKQELVSTTTHTRYSWVGGHVYGSAPAFNGPTDQNWQLNNKTYDGSQVNQAIHQGNSWFYWYTTTTQTWTDVNYSLNGGNTIFAPTQPTTGQEGALTVPLDGTSFTVAGNTYRWNLTQIFAPIAGITTTYYYDGTPLGSTDSANAVWTPINPGVLWTAYDSQSYDIIPAGPVVTTYYAWDNGVTSCDTDAPAVPTNLSWTDDNNVNVLNNGTTNRYSGVAGWEDTSNDVDHYIYNYWNDIATSPYNSSNKYTVTVGGTTLPGVFNQGEGVHHFCVQAVDAVGNTSACSTTFTVTYSLATTTDTTNNTPSTPTTPSLPTVITHILSSVVTPATHTSGSASTGNTDNQTPAADDSQQDVLGTSVGTSSDSTKKAKTSDVAKLNNEASANFLWLGWWWLLIVAAFLCAVGYSINRYINSNDVN